MNTHADSLVHERAPRRWGLRSLSGRLLILLLVPLALAQVMVVRELDEQRDAADDAASLSAGIALMSTTGSLYAPTAFEKMTSLGMTFVDGLGVPRGVVTDIIGIDYVPLLRTSRDALDSALAALVERDGGRTMLDGRTVRVRVGQLTQEIATMRAAIDQRAGDPSVIRRTMNGVLDFIDELALAAQPESATMTSAPELTALARRSAHLLSVVATVAAETRTVAEVLGASDGTTTADEALLLAGAAQYAINTYEADLLDDPEALARWTELRTSAPLVGYDALRRQITDALAARSGEESAGSAEAFGENPALLQQLAGILQTAFDRLISLEEYTSQQLDDATVVARGVGDEADRRVALWTVLLIGLTIVMVAFFVLTIWVTVRPLARLTKRALQIGRGELDPEPLPVTGPSDIRAVVSTFNTVTSTLSTFEHQLSRMASGREPDPDDLAAVPGALGASLRASVGRLADVTQRLRHSEALATAIVETAADAIWTIDLAGRILTVNDTGERLLGQREEAQRGQHLPTLLGGRIDVADLDGEIEFRRANGSVAHVLVSHSLVPAEPRAIHAVFARDISERKRFEERLAFQARFDVLTGLPNRLAAFEHLDEALARGEQTGQPVAVLFIDLDGFKAINDSRGHASGDRLLQEVARRLRSGLRDTEFVGRLGGDEFLIVMESTDKMAALSLGERVIVNIAQPFQADGDLFVVSASIGVAIGTAALDGLELVRQADVAVYHAKDRGRGRVAVFDDSLQAAVEANAEVELALRHAIMAGELELFFQPVLDVAERRIWGAEALLRWNRPGHGQLLPDRFIPVAERSSLILDLGRWVLHSACHTLAAWQHDPQRDLLHLAVNVSGRHLVEGDLVGDVRAAIEATGADPHSLEIELTETHLLADVDRANDVLVELREMGIDIAVDDFGTGYSSMSYLRELEIDTIKIDRMFIARAQDPGYDRTIVEVLLQLGRTLQLDVVAEGVENADQLAFLTELGCGRVQGYHVARPMPLSALETWLSTPVTSRSGGRG